MRVGCKISNYSYPLLILTFDPEKLESQLFSSMKIRVKISCNRLEKTYVFCLLPSNTFCCQQSFNRYDEKALSN